MDEKGTMNNCIIGDTRDFVSESEAEAQENMDPSLPWLGSHGSQGCGIPESPAESSDEVEFSDVERSLDTQPFSFPKSDAEHPEFLESRDSKLVLEQRLMYDLSAGEDEDSHQEEDIYPNYPRKNPHITSPTPLFSKSECHGSHSRQMPGPLSLSSSSSLGYAPEMTPASTLATDEPLGASNRQGQGTGNREVESSEEGGSSEAPPAAVSFGISDEGAKQAEKWNSESDTDLCRQDRHRARCTRLGQDESQSQRQVKETKSKCKRIARLLTDASNPQNKGALLFKKRQQRVKKYTLVSYGTGKSKFDSGDRLEEGAEEIQEAGLDFVAISESQFGEEYSIYQRPHDLSANWGSVQEMEVLPGTKGKGVLMFAHRRKRMEEVVSEQELHNKGLYLKTRSKPGYTVANNMYNMQKIYDHSEQGDYMNRHIHQMDQQRALVSNRTAKPFSGLHVWPADHSMPASAVPVRKTESRSKVPVPIISNQQVWSPTGDIIASRDERISVPAIKTCSFPESRRKISNKQQQTTKQGSDPRESRAHMESEEDCFSLGAEACNFMQPRAIKLKNPPPVAPKPAINPKCPPWLKGPPSEPCIPPRSSVSQPKYLVEPQRQHHYFNQHSSKPQKLANYPEEDRAQAIVQTPAVGRASVSSTSQLRLQPAINSWNKPLPRSAVSMQAYCPTFTPLQTQLTARSKQDSAQNSVASCPPKPMKSFTSKMSLAPPKGQVFGQGFDHPGDARTMMGKGAELFSKRQSRMEKFVVGGPTANQIRCPSPTMSLPNSWRYSSNVRAPPPLSYNPLHSPFYNPPAEEKAPSTKTTATPKSVPKHLNTLDIVKHQPYHLDSSLFHHILVPEAKSPSAKHAPPSTFEITKKLKQRSAHSHSPNIFDPDFESKSEASAKSSSKSSGPVSSSNLSSRQNTKSAELLAVDGHLDEKHAGHHPRATQAPSIQTASTLFQRPSRDSGLASAFPPASLIARVTRQMAPWPKFSAKKSVATTKQWRPVAMLN